jgi:hypothetical protein
MKTLNPTPFTCALALITLFLLSGCVALELALPEGIAEFSATELGSVEALVPENMALIREISSEDAVVSISPSELSRVNSVLERIYLKRVPGGGMPQLYVEGHAEPFADVYPERGEFKMLKTGNVYPMPSTILSVTGDGVCLRSNASLTNSIIRAHLNRGSLVVRLGEENGWYEVSVAQNNTALKKQVSQLATHNASPAMNSNIHPIKATYNNSMSSTVENVSTPLSEAINCVNGHITTKSLFFSDNFFDNHYSWRVYSSNKIQASLNSGFAINNLLPGLSYSFPANPIIESQNSEIIVSAMHLNGEINRGYGIIFNYINNQRFWLFRVSADGKYCVTQHFDGTAKDLIPWTYSDKIKAGNNQSNSLGIKMCDTHFLFLINDSPVEAIAYTCPQGSIFGLFIDGTQSILFINFYLYGTQSQTTW